MHAIVLDGSQRAALAITRSLGRRGIDITVGEEKAKSLSGYSRYCRRTFVYPSPYEDPQGFIEAVKEQTAKSGRATLIPVTDITLNEVLKCRGDFGENIALPFVEHEKYVLASDKESLFRVARELHIPIPATLFSADYKLKRDLQEAVMALGFPAVLKPARSMVPTKSGWMKAPVRYVKDEDELALLMGKEPFSYFPFLIQERIQGQGIGIFLLMKDGEVLARFAHMRLREIPPSGGASVLCESMEPHPAALEAAEKLLGHLCWSGVAMVEFKLDKRDNLPKLMEINARFWGSLQLAISAGVDFPYLLFRLAQGEKPEAGRNYRVGIKSRWELGDLDHVLMRLFKSRDSLSLPLNPLPVGRLIAAFLRDCIDPVVRNEILRYDDPMPFFYELQKYLRGRTKKLLSNIYRRVQANA